ncbi:MAG TPA: hypothetical protein VIM16_15330 [Mucilaginibacter sp.]|jgi:hypothetical protein
MKFLPAITKLILLAIIVLVGTKLDNFAQTTSSSPAKEGGKFSIGLEAGLPAGDATNNYCTVAGGSLKYELPTAANTYFTISAGYSAFHTKSDLKNLGYLSAYDFFPVKAGIKYYADDGSFLEGQSGIVFRPESDGGGRLFVWAPGIGYSFGDGFEAGARYESWSNSAAIGQIALRLSARF